MRRPKFCVQSELQLLMYTLLKGACMCVISHTSIGLYSVGLLISNRRSRVYGCDPSHPFYYGKASQTRIDQLFDMWEERFLSCRANLLYL